MFIYHDQTKVQRIAKLNERKERMEKDISSQRNGNHLSSTVTRSMSYIGSAIRRLSEVVVDEENKDQLNENEQNSKNEESLIQGRRLTVETAEKVL